MMMILNSQRKWSLIKWIVWTAEEQNIEKSDLEFHKNMDVEVNKSDVRNVNHGCLKILGGAVLYWCLL